MPFQRAAEGGEVEVAIHARELGRCFDHVGGARPLGPGDMRVPCELLGFGADHGVELGPQEDREEDDRLDGHPAAPKPAGGGARCEGWAFESPYPLNPAPV